MNFENADWELLQKVEEIEQGWEVMSYAISEEDIDFEFFAELIRDTVNLFKSQQGNYNLRDYWDLIFSIGRASYDSIEDTGRLVVSKIATALSEHIAMIFIMQMGDELNMQERILTINFDDAEISEESETQCLYDIDKGDFSELIEMIQEVSGL